MRLPIFCRHFLSRVQVNSGVRRHYNWETAQANAVQTRRRKPGNRSVDKDVMEEAKRLLITEQWSPEQISGVLAKDGKYISHELIYRMIRKDNLYSYHKNPILRNQD